MEELNIGHEKAKSLIGKYGSVRKAIDSINNFLSLFS